MLAAGRRMRRPQRPGPTSRQGATVTSVSSSSVRPGERQRARRCIPREVAGTIGSAGTQRRRCGRGCSPSAANGPHHRRRARRSDVASVSTARARPSATPTPVPIAAGTRCAFALTAPESPGHARDRDDGDIPSIHGLAKHGGDVGLSAYRIGDLRDELTAVRSVLRRAVLGPARIGGARLLAVSSFAVGLVTFGSVATGVMLRSFVERRGSRRKSFATRASATFRLMDEADGQPRLWERLRHEHRLSRSRCCRRCQVSSSRHSRSVVRQCRHRFGGS